VNILVKVVGTIDMLYKFSVGMWYTCCRQRNEIVHFFMCHLVVYTCQKLFNFIDAFNYYLAKTKGDPV